MPTTLTPERERQLGEVHRAVLRVFNWQEDWITFGRPEHWGLPKEVGGRLVGDCDNFTFACFHRLLALGWPAIDLNPAFCLVPGVGGHLVLAVETDRGVYILDNRASFVQPIDRVPYVGWMMPKRGRPISEPWEIITMRSSAPSQTPTRQPRGVRNNNPGNIVHSARNPWQGLDDPPTDGRFCRFINPTYGIRALAVLLVTYQDRHGLRTIRRIIDRWAPPNENNTSGYVDFVANRTGFGADEHLDITEYHVMRPIVEAIIHKENGLQPYTDAQLDKALVMAGIEPPAKPVAKTGTVRAAQTAVGGAVGVGVIAEAAQHIEPVLPAIALLGRVMDHYPWMIIAILMCGMGYMLWRRIDDRRRGLR